MYDIVGIGANVCDTLMNVSEYPKEDTKLRADNVTVSGGGPCATGLVASSKLGANCGYIGYLTDDNSGKFLIDDFKKYSVSTELIRIKSGYISFSSCIWLSHSTSSRTCVFHKGTLPPLQLDEDQKNAIKNAKILMVDGNDMAAAIEGAKLARENGTRVLYDAGGLYDGVENLLPYADILIPSEEFALGHTKTKNVEAAAKILFEKYSPSVVVITQGKEGGVLYDGKNLTKYPAFVVEAIDTNGSGDVFHGAFAYAITRDYNYYDACIFSSAVSALKCTKIGARGAVPTYDETIKFLKERGANV